MLLSKHQALLEGSKLWVIPENTFSPWNRRINWLINFQLSKAKKHKDPQLSPWIKSCIKETGIELPEMSNSDTILIPVKHQLPTDWLCQISVQKNLDNWAKNINKVWNQLQQPKMRVFLPLGTTHEDWQIFWFRLEPNEELTLVSQNEEPNYESNLAKMAKPI
jgi:hypothetical protein